MAIRNAILGGTDYSDGEVLYDYDLDDTNNELTYYLPRTYAATNMTTSALTTEAVIASITIPAGTLGTSATIMVQAGVYATGGGGSGTQNHTCTVYVYTPTGGTTQINQLTLTTNASTASVHGGALFGKVTGVNNSGTVILRVTQVKNASTNPTGCNAFTATAYKKVLT